MKLPFSLGTRLILRLLLPGIILAAASAPLLHYIIFSISKDVDTGFLFTVQVFFFGWMITLMDMLIYMLFEGRRFWPTQVRKYFIKLEERRLRKIISDTQNGSKNIDENSWREAWNERSKFPIGENNMPIIQYPTRLGNIIAEYEQYSKIRYGISSIFFWSRIWVKLDKDLRDEIDSNQAMVDCSVYISFVFWVTGVLFLAYSVLQNFNVDLPYLSSPVWTFILAIFSFMLAIFIYRISLHAHHQFGEMFKAVFDQYKDVCKFDDIASEFNKGDRMFKEMKERNEKIWRYLRWNIPPD